MAATARSVRSDVSRPAAKPQTPPRPELRLITNTKAQEQKNVFGRVLAWTRSRTAPLVHVVIAVVFLAATLIGALMLRTEMVQNSFEAQQIEQNISVLTQDVEDDQAKLDQLIASLPDKASEMGMVPQQGSVSIDLNGYKPSEGGSQQ
ncbi:hypothetical protein [Bifidobacterium oedipodis]|uniref:Cell division protein FtsL n=1 Tax=Bifidobacterium oedipodis TaxID=2675322 RepID=A0A7Y0EMG4_9BIFI|nr:hypothetical protein [Bifidobacterium sp. DSM 109957]NMM92946.1 hypothetical protein [Bifidobacterium sp. DSM 109957]